MRHCVEVELGGKHWSIETGTVAMQANGAVLSRCGETVVLVTAVGSDHIRDVDFLPLNVEYMERTFAAGKIPGGYIKREGRPTEKEIITSRLIDRPLRPLFPKGYRYDTQVIAMVLSADGENDPDIVALNGASAALSISDIPFDGPIAAVRVGRVRGEFVLNPGLRQLKEGDLDLTVVGREGAILMLEGHAKGLSEETVLEAVFYGYRALQGLLSAIASLAQEAGTPKREIPAAAEMEPALLERIQSDFEPLAEEVLAVADRHERSRIVSTRIQEIKDALAAENAEQAAAVGHYCEEIYKRAVRRRICESGRRLDGRKPAEIRPLSSRVGILPRTHGSALFTRGETQALVVTTLGTSGDEQRMELLEGEISKRFMLHYNFPPFCVGEVRPLRSPGRREIGHGVLAERALASVIPPVEEFPYTIRVVSDILSSNGSSSMATVCGATLSLMDAGVPISTPVAGIAMGLLKEGETIRILTDIAGEEDHYGDMDLKVARCRDGIRAIQMDIKIPGITKEILGEALSQAKEACLEVLDHMQGVIAAPRKDLSVYAPRIVTIQIKPERIKDVIGPGGRTIREIIEKTGVRIDIEDSGKVNIASTDRESAQQAIRLIESLTQEAEVGKIYQGVVKKITNYGAFVEIFPGMDGLIHISQLAKERVENVSDILSEGDEVWVKIIEVDRQGRIKLSRREALESSELQELERTQNHRR